MRKLSYCFALAALGFCAAVALAAPAIPAQTKPPSPPTGNAIPDTDILFILDESGSMQPLQDDTIGGYNNFIDKQKNQLGKTWLTTVFFNSDYRVICDRVSIDRAPRLNRNVYSPTSTTALYDAVGRGLTDLDRFRRDERHPSERVIVVIVTDGQENASREYTHRQIKDMITKRTARGWKFIYMGANVESATEARSIGVGSNSAMNFTATGAGLKKAFGSAESAVNNYRQTGELGAWKQEAPEAKPQPKKLPAPQNAPAPRK